MTENNENVSPVYTNICIPEKILQALSNRSNPTSSQSSLEQKMLMVPTLLRQEKNCEYEYDPMLVSLGPYHHGKKELQLAEDFKVKALEMLVADSGKDPFFFYNKVLEVVIDARNCYIDSFTSQYDDPNFAQMMLLDACFIINLVLMGRVRRNYDVTTNCLGYFYVSLTLRDLFLLENQIPFWLVKMLICLRYGKESGEEMLNEYLNSTLFGDYKRTGIASSDVEQPFHLLDAFWRILVSQDSIQTVSPQMITPAPHQPTNKLSNLNKNCISLLKNISKRTDKKDEEDCSARKLIHSFRSVSDLKSRGIHFRPSSGNSLKSIRFKPGNLTATLEVPVWFVSHYTKGFFLNMIAYELCPNTSTADRAITAYIEFMKALIDNPKDVKELREKKILLTTLGNDEDVVKVYKELNTYGMENIIIFHNIKEEIQAHYNSKGKTWLAELISVYLRTPWKVIALLAAILLLFFTSVQTYFTLNPRKG